MYKESIPHSAIRVPGILFFVMFDRIFTPVAKIIHSFLSNCLFSLFLKSCEDRHADIQKYRNSITFSLALSGTSSQFVIIISKLQRCVSTPKKRIFHRAKGFSTPYFTLLHFVTSALIRCQQLFQSIDFRTFRMSLSFAIQPLKFSPNGDKYWCRNS